MSARLVPAGIGLLLRRGDKPSRNDSNPKKLATPMVIIKQREDRAGLVDENQGGNTWQLRKSHSRPF